MKEGDPSNEFFVMLEGSVNILKGELPTLVGAEHGTTCLGEAALLGVAGRSATVRAESKVRTLVFQKSALESLMREDQGFGYRLMAAMAGVLFGKLSRLSARMGGS
jgi:CRP-like cAMP-binding protein